MNDVIIAENIKVYSGLYMFGYLANTRMFVRLKIFASKLNANGK